MGNNSGKERHGSSGTAVDTYETPPASPYSLVSTWSPTTQLVSISNCTSTATPETAQDALSPPLISTNQNDSLLESRTGPAKEAEEEHKITQVSSLASHPSGVCVNGDEEVDAKLLQECLNTLQLDNTEESTHILNDLLQCFLVEREKMKEELRSCKEKIQAEREEWQQFQADLKVALVVSDRLRAESEEELSSLRAAMQDMGTQLANALQGRREIEGQLESLRVELEQSKQKMKQVTGSHQGAPTLRGPERQVEANGKSTGPEEHLWTDEMKGKREMRIAGTAEKSRSLCRLPSNNPDVVVNGTSQPSVAMTTESTPQSKTPQAASLEQQNNMTSSIKDKKVENSNPQTSNSSGLDVANKINRTRTQEDFPSGLRSLRLHGSSRRNSLLRWCQGRTQGYKNIEITNFSSCWVDGLAFCAIYHSYLPSHIPFDKLSPENKKENLTLAFQTGEGFGISASLTVEEMLKMMLRTGTEFWNM